MKDDSQWILPALVRELAPFLSEEKARAAIRDAIFVARLKAVPFEPPQALREFIVGPLARSVERRGAPSFALEAERIADHLLDLLSPDESTVRTDLSARGRGVLATLDASIFDQLKARLADRLELRQARRLLDLAPLSGFRRSTAATLIVHVDTSPIQVTTLAKLSGAFPPGLRIVLAGVSDRALAVLAKRFPAVSSWSHAPTLDALVASL
ncbi:MAG: hypothetical protein IT378_03565 [Sandaracinaceae bacterium]|nr:hypothetical protein [Sandaracinaceae bacterium]